MLLVFVYSIVIVVCIVVVVVVVAAVVVAVVAVWLRSEKCSWPGQKEGR